MFLCRSEQGRGKIYKYKCIWNLRFHVLHHVSQPFKVNSCTWMKTCTKFHYGWGITLMKPTTMVHQNRITRIRQWSTFDTCIWFLDVYYHPPNQWPPYYVKYIPIWKTNSLCSHHSTCDLNVINLEWNSTILLAWLPVVLNHVNCGPDLWWIVNLQLIMWGNEKQVVGLSKSNWMVVYLGHATCAQSNFVLANWTLSIITINACTKLLT